MLIDCTLELAEEYKRANNVHNYVKTTAACAVFVIIMYCGTRARQEIADTICTDFTDIHPAMIMYQQSSDSKQKKLASNYTFIEREASYIIGEKYCNILRFSLYKGHRDQSCVSLYMPIVIQHFLE